MNAPQISNSQRWNLGEISAEKWRSAIQSAFAGFKTSSKYLSAARLRDFQMQTLEALRESGEVLTVVPTGSGKSLIYLLLGRVAKDSFQRPGVVLVVSPLVALMGDQERSARNLGLQARAIHSGLDRMRREAVLAELAVGKLEILFLTPERFRKPELWQALEQANGVSALVVDEAHCVSTWGHDFRLDYSRLGDIRERLGRPPTLALTATARKRTREDICSQLRFSATAREFVSSVRRHGLAIEIHRVHGTDEKIRAIVAFLHGLKGAALVYFSLIQSLETVGRELQKLGIKHSKYHGGLPDAQRKRAEASFLRGSSTQKGDGLDVMLATPAFGLGVNRPDVRVVIHAEIPGSIEAYTQEVGRAGRDGLPAQAIGLFDPDDVTIQSDFLKWSSPDPTFIQGVFALIRDRNLQARQEGLDFLRTQMNFYNRRDFRVETSLNLLERWGCIRGTLPKDWEILEDVPEELKDHARYKDSAKHKSKALAEVIDFFERDLGELSCRQLEIARLFGESGNTIECGVCDVCRSRPIAIS